MPLCPQNHLSAATDFCAVCGIEMRAPEPPPAPAATEPCAICGTPRETPQSVFCEVCGYNFATGAAPAAATPNGTDGTHTTYATHGPSSSYLKDRWEIEARVLPDADPEAPRDAPTRVFPLDLPDLLIGRRSPRRGILPEIALDPDDGISHRHARLRRRDDGGFDLLDLGSANGTARNGAALEPNVPVSLQAGDLIRLGRWTELLVRTL